MLVELIIKFEEEEEEEKTTKKLILKKSVDMIKRNSNQFHSLLSVAFKQLNNFKQEFLVSENVITKAKRF